MSKAPRHRSFGLVLAFASGFIFTLTGFLAWLLDSFVWDWLETAAEHDPFLLSEEVKFLILHLKKTNLVLVGFSGLVLALSIALRMQLDFARIGLMLVFAVAMLAALGFPVLEWRILDRLFVDPEEAYDGFEGRMLSFKLVTGSLCVVLALILALGIDRLSRKEKGLKTPEEGA